MDSVHPHNSSPSSPDSASCRLLNALPSVLPLFHAFLTDADAARLLRASNAAALALLSGYTFATHVFQPASVASLRRLRDLALTYGLRVTQLALPRRVEELTFDPTPPHPSPIPSSVLALSLGPPLISPVQVEPHWAAVSAAARDWQDLEPWRLPYPQPSARSDGKESSADEKWKAALQQRWQDGDEFWPFDPLLPAFIEYQGGLQQPLPPGLLPDGLRVLRSAHGYNQPLQAGNLPARLTLLHFASGFRQPLLPGVLPAELLYLSLPVSYYAPLVVGSLPASLQRLRLDAGFSYDVAPGVLPSRLQALHVGATHAPLQPGSLPASLLYLSTSHYFTEPILAGVLPSCLVDLRLGHGYNHPLRPGILPASLCRLTLGGQYRQPLQLGSLPDGLLLLRFLPTHSSAPKLPPVLPGVLPSTLLGLDFTNRYHAALLAGVVPASVRWVRLPREYDDERTQAVLPPHAERSFFG